MWLQKAGDSEDEEEEEEKGGRANGWSVAFFFVQKEFVKVRYSGATRARSLCFILFSTEIAAGTFGCGDMKSIREGVRLVPAGREAGALRPGCGPQDRWPAKASHLSSLGLYGPVSRVHLGQRKAGARGERVGENR